MNTENTLTVAPVPAPNQTPEFVGDIVSKSGRILGQRYQLLDPEAPTFDAVREALRLMHPEVTSSRKLNELAREKMASKRLLGELRACAIIRMRSEQGYVFYKSDVKKGGVAFRTVAPPSVKAEKKSATKRAEEAEAKLAKQSDEIAELRMALAALRKNK